MTTFRFTFSLRGEKTSDKVEIEAPTLTQAVTLFLEGQWPDGEIKRTCDQIAGFLVERL